MIELLNNLAGFWALYILQNSLQILIYFLLVVAVALLSSRQSATFKYWLWFSVFLVALIPPLITIPVNIPAIPLLPDEQIVTQLQDFETQSQGEVMSGHETTVQISWPGILFLGWLLAAGAMVLSTVIRTRSFYQQIRAKKYPVSQTLLQRCNLPVATPVFWSHAVDTPVTIGFLAPEIILPDEMQEWDHGEISAILWHEYAHVRRRDNLLLMVQHLAHAVFFFHPIIWVSRYFSGLYQEQACDDLAILAGDESPQNIGRSLSKIMKNDKSTTHTLVFSEFHNMTKWKLRNRIINLYSKGISRMTRLRTMQKLTLALIIATGLMLSCQFQSETNQNSTFEAKQDIDIKSGKSGIAGIVYDKITDKPIAGAKISIQLNKNPIGVKNTVQSDSVKNQTEVILVFTGEDGTYTVKNIDPGYYKVACTHPNGSVAAVVHAHIKANDIDPISFNLKNRDDGRQILRYTAAP